MKTKIIILFAGILSIMMVGCNSLPHELQQLEKLTIFKVSKDKKAIVLDGVINSSALKQFKKVAESNPSIKTLHIVNCEGSINDEVNLQLAKYIYDKGFKIHLLDNGLIASGGTDLFLAGHQRTIGKNTKIGVHSWAGENEKATDFPKDHKYHQPYIEYYKSVGFTQKQAEDFYFFTIHSAPPEDVHFMTKEELETYNILTK
ncbi:hypothetical protein [Pseudotenacibaculum haliotis]|uniref:Alpha/beta hydrolase n=1 Tax=Pseudotenacibaculum haliotis TaxID=1862138 RepID=A0ABW5LUU4_9FLAO